MQQFARLFDELDASTSVKQKVQALVTYFNQADPADAAWAVYFLGGGRPKRAVPAAVLRQAALQASGLPSWLFEECYQTVGDLAETIALVLPAVEQEFLLSRGEHDIAWWMQHRILPIRALRDQERAQAVLECWSQLDRRGRFLFVKLVGGGFRVGVSKLLVTRALAQAFSLDAKLIATRMMGYHDSKNSPSPSQFRRLIAPAECQTLRLGQPFPFFLAHPLQSEPQALGDIHDWLVEWKYDGIRAQVVKQAGQVWIWSRGEELISEQFPELTNAFSSWPDGTVLDGEILVWKGNKPADFGDLQVRLNRKVVSRKLLGQAPVVFMAYDCLSFKAEAQVHKNLFARRRLLEAFVQGFYSESLFEQMGRLMLSEVVHAENWAELAALRQSSRDRGVEGLMLKQLDSCYGVGRTKSDGLWFKWKVDPMTIDCVLVYAQRGHGRRANLYTDYTFAVWDSSPQNAMQVEEVVQAIEQGEAVANTRARGLPCLVPFAKAYSGLTDDEFKRVDREIKRNTVNKFGPVRIVKPTMMFEIGFEAIARSSRHKSGIAVRFPRMLRIRDDKPIEQADTLASLEALLRKA